MKYEKIFVSGLQVGGNFKYQFIETALHDIDEKLKNGTKPEDITWIIFNHEEIYKDNNDFQHFTKTANKLGINLVKVDNRNEFINYINYKDIKRKTDLREQIKIIYISVFGHGQTPRFTGGVENMLSFGYDLDDMLNIPENNAKSIESEINFLQSHIQQISYDAFEKYKNETYFFTCNTGTADTYGLRFAKQWADHTVGTVHAFQNARSNYTFINTTNDPFEVWLNYPGDKFDIAISDYLNGLLEFKTNMDKKYTKMIIDFMILLDRSGKLEKRIDELTEDELDKLLNIMGEVTGIKPTAQWVEKQKRSAERVKVHKDDGKKYGYSNKGSLHYPAMNNVGDDYKIILGTPGEERGFLTYTYSTIQMRGDI